jgi:multiple sugar transport system permease protein
MADLAASPAPATALARRRRRPVGEQGRWGYLFVAPTALGLGIFYMWPALGTIYQSFTQSGPFGGSTWVGLANYRQLLHDPQMFQTLRNTIIYTVVALLSIPIAMVVAVLLNQRGLRFLGFYRMLYFLPVVTMPAAVSIVWRMLYNGDFGTINTALRWVGIDGTSWLTNPHTALFAVAIIGIWASIGANMVIFLAGLQGVPRHLYEAAEIDGAGPVRRFTKITLPMTSPSIFFASVLTVIHALQVFDYIFMTVDPANPAFPQVRSVVYMFYQESFVENQRGYGATIAFVLLLLILALTLIQFRLQRRWVHYD